MKQERIIYEEQPFYSLERVPKPRENGFRTRYLVKLAVAGAVCVNLKWMPMQYSTGHRQRQNEMRLNTFAAELKHVCTCVHHAQVMVWGNSRTLSIY